MRRKLEAIGRELRSVTEAEYASLATTAPSPRRHRAPPEGIKRSSSGHWVLPLDAPAAPQTPPQPAGQPSSNVVPLPPHLLERRTITPEGTGREVLLQVGRAGGRAGGGAGLGCAKGRAGLFRRPAGALARVLHARWAPQAH